MYIKKIALSMLTIEMALLSSQYIAGNNIYSGEIQFQHEEISASISEIKSNIIDIKNIKMDAEKEIEHISIVMEQVETEIHSNIDRGLIYQIVDNAMTVYGIYEDTSHHEIVDYPIKLEAMNYIGSEFNKLNYYSNYFDIYDITRTSGLSEDQFNLILSGSNLDGMGYIFVNIEKEYEINGLFILSIAKQESGLGSSNMALTKNNLTGYMAYDANTGAARKFVDFEDCLMTTARLIKRDYLTEEGKYYHGKSIFSINIKYCSQIDWSIKLIDIMYGSVERLLKNNLQL